MSISPLFAANGNNLVLQYAETVRQSRFLLPFKAPELYVLLIELRRDV